MTLTTIDLTEFKSLINQVTDKQCKIFLTLTTIDLTDFKSLSNQVTEKYFNSDHNDTHFTKLFPLEYVTNGTCDMT